VKTVAAGQVNEEAADETYITGMGPKSESCITPTYPTSFSSETWRACWLGMNVLASVVGYAGARLLMMALKGGEFVHIVLLLVGLGAARLQVKQQ
jgi:hypothetical protein